MAADGPTRNKAVRALTDWSRADPSFKVDENKIIVYMAAKMLLPPHKNVTKNMVLNATVPACKITVVFCNKPTV